MIPPNRENFSSEPSGLAEAPDCRSLLNANLGGYEVVEFLGAGGMSCVFRAEKVVGGQPLSYALKTLRATAMRGDTQARDRRARFDREARAQARLQGNHHVCGVHHYETDPRTGVVYLVMDLAAGGTLEDLARDHAARNEPFPWRESVDWMRQLTLALEAAQQCNPPIVHRDVKPGNILLREDRSTLHTEDRSHVMLADFGIARIGEPGTGGEAMVTLETQWVGTVGYCPPEQMRGRADFRSDMYALGMTFYKLLTGESHCDWEPREGGYDPGEHRSDLPRRLRQIIQRMTRSRPEDRYPSFAKLRAEVEAVRFAGRYLLERRLGKGAMGEVWFALRDDVGADRLSAVAIKRMLLQPSAGGSSWGDEGKRYFVQEAQILLQLADAPNVCRVHECQIYRGEPYLVMDYAEGGSLRTHLDALWKRGGQVDVLQAVRWMAQAATGLRAALNLDRPTFHRDIKPGNLLLSKDGEIKVADFGIAKSTGGEAPGLTRTGTVAYTLGYAPPEQMVGRADHRSDIFALGITFFEALTAQPIQKGLTPAGFDVGRFRKDAPPRLRRLIRQMTQANPDARPQSYDDLVAQLRSIESDLTRTWWDRLRMPVAVALTLIAAASVAWAVGLGTGGGPVPERRAPMTLRQVRTSLQSDPGARLDAIVARADGEPRLAGLLAPARRLRGDLGRIVDSVEQIGRFREAVPADAPFADYVVRYALAAGDVEDLDGVFGDVDALASLVAAIDGIEAARAELPTLEVGDAKRAQSERVEIGKAALASLDDPDARAVFDVAVRSFEGALATEMERREEVLAEVRRLVESGAAPARAAELLATDSFQPPADSSDAATASWRLWSDQVERVARLAERLAVPVAAISSEAIPTEESAGERRGAAFFEGLARGIDGILVILREAGAVAATIDSGQPQDIRRWIDVGEPSQGQDRVCLQWARNWLSGQLEPVGAAWARHAEDLQREIKSRNQKIADEMLEPAEFGQKDRLDDRLYTARRCRNLMVMLLGQGAATAAFVPEHPTTGLEVARDPQPSGGVSGERVLADARKAAAEYRKWVDIWRNPAATHLGAADRETFDDFDARLGELEDRLPGGGVAGLSQRDAEALRKVLAGVIEGWNGVRGSVPSRVWSRVVGRVGGALERGDPPIADVLVQIRDLQDFEFRSSPGPDEYAAILEAIQRLEWIPLASMEFPETAEDPAALETWLDAEDGPLARWRAESRSERDALIERLQNAPQSLLARSVLLPQFDRWCDQRLRVALAELWEAARSRLEVWTTNRVDELEAAPDAADRAAWRAARLALQRSSIHELESFATALESWRRWLPDPYAGQIRGWERRLEAADIPPLPKPPEPVTVPDDPPGDPRFEESWLGEAFEAHRSRWPESFDVPAGLRPLTATESADLPADGGPYYGFGFRTVGERPVPMVLVVPPDGTLAPFLCDVHEVTFSELFASGMFAMQNIGSIALRSSQFWSDGSRLSEMIVGARRRGRWSPEDADLLAFWIPEAKAQAFLRDGWNAGLPRVGLGLLTREQRDHLLRQAGVRPPRPTSPHDHADFAKWPRLDAAHKRDSIAGVVGLRIGPRDACAGERVRRLSESDPNWLSSFSGDSYNDRSGRIQGFRLSLELSR